MSISQENRCIFIGLPNSGKSSFIGALWHVIESGEISTTYSVVTRPGDREYLTRLRNSFLDCKSVERTKTDFLKNISLDMEETSTGKSANFIFPDLSGETYISQFEYRKLTNDYVEQISGCHSIMLFVNPSFVKKGFLISNVDEMLFEDDVKEGIETLSENQVDSDTEVKWSPKLCQTQVILVDLLQIIAGKTIHPFKINVIISAWDVIKNLPNEEADIAPDEWLIKELPLLYQYLSSNNQKFPFRVFGVSAQGGEYSEVEEENIELHAKIKQSERILVQSGSEITHDITVPLKWLFE